MSKIRKKIGLTIAALLTVFTVGYKTLPNILPLPKADIKIQRSQNVDREYYKQELEKSQQRQDRMCDLNDFEMFDMGNHKKMGCLITLLNYKPNVFLETEYLKSNEIIKKLGQKIIKSCNEEELPESIFLTLYSMFNYFRNRNEEKTPIQLSKEYEESSFWPLRRKIKGDCTEMSPFCVSLVRSMGKKGLEAYIIDVLQDENEENQRIHYISPDPFNDLFIVKSAGGHIGIILKFNNKPILLDLTRKDGFDISYKKIKVLNGIEAISIHHDVLARVSDRTGKLDEAVQNYLTIVLNDPKNIRVHNSLGVVYLKKGEYEQAVGEFEKIVEINPKHNLAYNNLGIAYFFLNKFDKAIKCYDLALANEDINKNCYIKRPFICYNKAIAFLTQGEIHQGVEEFHKVLTTALKDRVVMHVPQLNADLTKRLKKHKKEYSEIVSIIEKLDPDNFYRYLDK